MFVDADGIRLFVDAAGSEWAFDGAELVRRPVVLGLHGGPGLDGTALRHYLAPLADAAQVFVPDQRGHGRSDHGTPETWTLEAWARDANALCGTLGIERPVVLGVSFGGFVAQRYASDYPDAPAGLVLASTAPRFASADEAVERVRQVGGDEAAAAAMRRDLESPSEESGAEWERLVGPLCSLVRDPIEERLQASRIRTMEVNLEFMRRSREMDLRPGLARVRCPTLVLVGERDPLVPIELAAEVVDAVPDGLGRLEVVPQAAHELFGDNPDETYRLVRGFLDELD